MPDELQFVIMRCDFEVTMHGWNSHPAERVQEGRISSEEDLEDKVLMNIYTDSSKYELGVDTSFCILDEQQKLTPPCMKGFRTKIQWTRKR
ncbi:hypothetical protein AVEN_20096-1 [Araneus ventricosus]|uniref:Uncharacterized protein n=1 Tax=Araneus ventricosus TaxID=182803 RepID=A0A4Y2MHH1_ARAVE|nr:hypothetical protein AVEN_20096-1 [Araneus ventricosus]